MKEDNILKIKKELKEIPWDSIMFSDNVDENFDIFHNQLQECISRNTTEKRITIPYKQRLKEPWMTPGIKKATRKKTAFIQTNTKNTKYTERQAQIH